MTEFAAMPTFDIKAFNEDWREVAESVPADRYGNIVASAGGEDFKILRISHYDEDVDGGRKMVDTASRDFDDAQAYFSHVTRDAHLTRAITLRGKRKFVLEPGPQVIGFKAAREGVSVKTFIAAAREGILGRRIAEMAIREEKDARLLAEAKVQVLEARIQDLKEETAMLNIELRAARRELASRGAE